METENNLKYGFKKLYKVTSQNNCNEEPNTVFPSGMVPKI